MGDAVCRALSLAGCSPAVSNAGEASEAHPGTQQAQQQSGAFSIQTADFTTPGDGVHFSFVHHPEGAEDGLGTDHDRRDAGEEAGRERETDENRHHDPQEQNGTEGDEPPDDEVGEGVEGERTDEPDPPPWEPADPGSGEWGSDNWPLDDYFTKSAAETMSHVMAGSWPDASRNLLHYLGNSGDPLEQDVDRMLEEIPGLQERADTFVDSLAEIAVREAQSDEIAVPVTYPVNTDWRKFGYAHGAGENRNWFYATGEFDMNVTGQITVYPPEEPGGRWRYEARTRVNYRDQYNWDGNKSTDILGFTITDEQLAELHRAGVAQEFLMYGRSEEHTYTGEM
ncbi:hypothetical protein GCM10027294_05350 [Marinactinospora endophytica]